MAVGVYISTLKGDADFAAAVDAMAVRAAPEPIREKRMRVVGLVADWRKWGWKRRGRSICGGAWRSATKMPMWKERRSRVIATILWYHVVLEVD